MQGNMANGSDNSAKTGTSSHTSKLSVQDRLRELKKARSKSVLDNRRAVYDEVAGIKSKRKLEMPDEIDDYELENKIEDTLDAEGKKKSELNVSVLEYTAEEDERWEAKQGRVYTHEALNDKDKGELHNYKQLAQRTYSKNIRNIEQRGKKKSSEEYQQEKDIYNKLKKQGLSEEQIRCRLTSTKKLDTYVKDLKSWEDDVFKKRRKVTDEGKDGAIHEKNREFNSKLDRHYRQFRE